MCAKDIREYDVHSRMMTMAPQNVEMGDGDGRCVDRIRMCVLQRDENRKE